jgi:Protein of unknown function (DUF952)
MHQPGLQIGEASRTQASVLVWKKRTSKPGGSVNVIYHIAARADGERARRDGEYTTSTIGRTLAEERFVHASRATQVAGVANRFYQGRNLQWFPHFASLFAPFFDFASLFALLLSGLPEFKGEK